MLCKQCKMLMLHFSSQASGHLLYRHCKLLVSSDYPPTLVFALQVLQHADEAGPSAPQADGAAEEPKAVADADATVALADAQGKAAANDAAPEAEGNAEDDVDGKKGKKAKKRKRKSQLVRP